MKAENKTTGYKRTIKITGIPDDQISEMEITVMYRMKPNDGETVHKGVVLDSIVIPAIISSFNERSA